MEDGDLDQAQIGPSLQFNTPPLEKLKRITIFEMDDVTPMPVVFMIGYRYLPSSVRPAIQRLQPIVMFHIPFPRTILLSDRNRGDLDWSNGSFHWTYRNRFTGERRLTIRSYHPGAYASAELFYQSQFAKWSSTLSSPAVKSSTSWLTPRLYSTNRETFAAPSQHTSM